MAELLVRVHDKVNKEDFYMNLECTKRGDVIAVQPDGWGWGKEELRHDFWRIFAVPGMSVAEAQSLLAPELNIDPTQPSATLQRRAFRLNLDAIDTPELTRFLLDDTRKQAVFTFPLGLIRRLKTAKARVPDPAIIGNQSPRVIG